MKKQEIIFFLILTLICVAVWIGSNIYDSYVTSTITPQETSQIAPIDPDFNTQVISELKKREHIDPYFQIPSITPTTNTTPTPQLLKTSTSSNSTQSTSGGKLK